MRNLLEYPITHDEKVKVLKDLIAEQQFALIEDNVEPGSKANIAFKEILEELTNVTYYPEVTKEQKIQILKDVIAAKIALTLDEIRFGDLTLAILQEILKDVKNA